MIDNNDKSKGKNTTELFDRDMFKKGISHVESDGGKKQWNETSSATGKYQFLYNNIKDLPIMRNITREQFMKNEELQEKVMDLAIEGKLNGAGYYRNAKDLTEEYKNVLGDKWKYRPDEVAAITHFLGRQGARNYFKAVASGKEYQVSGKVNLKVEEYLNKYNTAVDQNKVSKVLPEYNNDYNKSNFDSSTLRIQDSFNPQQFQKKPIFDFEQPYQQFQREKPEQSLNEQSKKNILQQTQAQFLEQYLGNNQFAFGGNLNNLSIDFENPIEKKDKVELEKITYNDFLYNTKGNDFEKNRISKYNNNFLNIHSKSNGSCLAGALNCNTDYIAPKLNVLPIRSLLAKGESNLKIYKIKNKPYSINGTVYAKLQDFVKNNSIDAWEIHEYMRGEKLGSDFFTSDKNTKYKGSLPENLDYSKIPIGAIIGQGDSSKMYTMPSDGQRSRHVVTVVGYDDDGMPMVYDYGHLTRLDDLKALNKTHRVTKITVPNGYDKYNYNYFKNQKQKHIKDLNLNDKPISYNSKKKHILSIEKGVNSVKKDIARDFNINQNIVEKIARYLPGLTMQETKINNNEEVSKSFIADNFIGNSLGKPVLKIADSLGSSVLNFIKETVSGKKDIRKQDYQLEIQAYKKYPNDEKKRNEYFNELSKNNKKLKVKTDLNLKSSVGPFAIKDLPEYARKNLGITKSDLYGINVSNEKELENGAKVALTFLAEKYTELKKQYPNLKDDELIDLSIVGFNNKSKTQDKEFVDLYIKNKKLKDVYLDKVKNFNKFDLGGDLKVNNMKNIFNDGGLLTEFNSGGTHEQNPMGGIPMGIGQNGKPNLVEEGETKSGNYVFSDRLILTDKIVKMFNLPTKLKNKTVADASKLINLHSEESAKSIDKETTKENLDRLKQANEFLKQDELLGQINNQFSEGGFMDFMKENGNMMGGIANGLVDGSTEGFIKAGLSVGANALLPGSGALVSPLVDGLTSLFDNRKAKRLAQDNTDTSAHFTTVNNTFGEGGYTDPILIDFQNENNKSQLNSKQGQPYSQNYLNETFPISTSDVKSEDIFKTPILNSNIDFEFSPLLGGKKKDTLQDRLFNNSETTEKRNLERNNRIMSSVKPKSFTDNIKKFGKKSAEFLEKNESALRYAPAIMNAYQLASMKKPEQESLNTLNTRFKNDYVDEAAMINQVNQQFSGTADRIANASNGSLGALRSNLLGAQSNQTNNLSNAFLQAENINRQQNMTGQQFNLGIDQFNIQQNTAEKDMNAKNRASYDNNKSRLLSQIGNDIGGVGLEALRKKYPELMGLDFDTLGKFLGKN